jgi:hypothetical protein
MSQATELNTPIPTRRALLAGAPVAAAAALAAGTSVNGLAAGLTTSSSTDPIFAVIAMHRTAIEECYRAVMVSGTMVGGGPNKDPNYDSADKETRDASSREREALYDVLTTQPTTLAGVVALLAHVALPEFLREEPGFENETILSACTNCTGKIKQAGKDFPARIAGTMRDIIERGQA